MSTRTLQPTSARPSSLPAVFALVAATGIWGSTFLVTKNTLDTMSVANFLTWRFGIAAVILLLVAPRRWLRLAPAELRRGIFLGVFLAAGFLAQTQGLRQTSAAVSGFLTGLMVVMTPLVAATAFRDRVTARGWAAVGVATLGLALLSLQGWQLSPGALITLVGATCFAVQIASLSQWATPANGYGLTAVSVTVAAVVCAGAGAIGGELSVPGRPEEWTALVYLAVVATCVGLLVQAWSQSQLPATTAAVIMTMEPVFAGVIAVAIGGEALSPRAWAGGLLIVAAMFIAELGPRAGRDARSPRVECC
jgi:drug/metabolite transporter (DMT)-like permease